MKMLVAFFAAVFLVCGCGHDEQSQQGQDRWQFRSLVWYQEEGVTNAELIITTGDWKMTNQVVSLVDAADQLGYYGWQVVQLGSEGRNQVIYLKRRLQPDTNGGMFYLHQF